jgi:tetratricopeptide (TPR) repeat protein
MALDLGDITVRLISFGKAGFDGMSIVVIPEEKLVVIPGFIVHVHHLAPHPHSSFTELDVPRWISIFEEILNGTSAVEKFVCGSDLWPKARVAAHLKYIKTLWERVAELEKAGKDLAAVQKILSMDAEFSFVKKMNVYLDYGDDWVRPQHLAHVKGFFLQHKKMGTALVRKMIKQMTIKEALQNVLALKKKDNAVYLDESTLNGLGYELLGTGKTADAIEVFETIVRMYPRSANAYDSLAEGYMKNGNKKLAIKYYKHSLKLNPKNKNAETMLQRLKE